MLNFLNVHGKTMKVKLKYGIPFMEQIEFLNQTVQDTLHRNDPNYFERIYQDYHEHIYNKTELAVGPITYYKLLFTYCF